MDCKAADSDDPTIDPRFGKVGRQVCKDTGPLTKARMVGIDDDIASRAVDFIQRQKNANKPFFVWVNFTHMRSAPTPSRKASASPVVGRAQRIRKGWAATKPSVPDQPEPKYSMLVRRQ